MYTDLCQIYPLQWLNFPQVQWLCLKTCLPIVNDSELANCKGKWGDFVTLKQFGRVACRKLSLSAMWSSAVCACSPTAMRKLVKNAISGIKCRIEILLLYKPTCRLAQSVCWRELLKSSVGLWSNSIGDLPGFTVHELCVAACILGTVMVGGIHGSGKSSSSR